MMIDHIKQAVFAAEELLNWTPDQTGHLYRSVSLLQSHYNDAVTQWRTANYPQTEAVSLAWITGTSAAEAGLLWLQEVSLAIESLQQHERGNGKPLSESEGFELIREALRDWYGYTPTKPEVVAMRMQFMAKLTIETNATQETEKPDAATDLDDLSEASGVDGRLARYLASQTGRVLAFKEIADATDPLTDQLVWPGDKTVGPGAIRKRVNSVSKTYELGWKASEADQLARKKM